MLRTCESADTKIIAASLPGHYQHIFPLFCSISNFTLSAVDVFVELMWHFNVWSYFCTYAWFHV